MQRDLVILSSSPRQPTSENRRREESYSQSSSPTSYFKAIDKRLKSGSNASKIPEDAVTDFRFASSLLPKEDREIALEHVSALGSEVQEQDDTINGIAEAGHKKKRTRRRKGDPAVYAGRKKKREAEKTTTPDGSRFAENVQKGKATGRVSAYFGTRKDLANNNGKTVDVAIDLTGSPPPRRKISWTPPKDNHPGIALDEAVSKISEFEYKDAEVGSCNSRQCTFTISKKIEVLCNPKAF
jgi:hypothetical protein